MSKHTPGPWAFKQGAPPSEIKLIGHIKRDIPHRGDGYVATVLSDENWRMHTAGHDECRRQAHANARLIAAAPDLLEALEEILEACNYDGVLVEMSAEAKANKAIAKAIAKCPAYDYRR